MHSKTILALSIIASLTGCGSSSSSNDDNGGNATTYTVMDGYLSNANICVMMPDDTCEYMGATDANGQLVIPAQYQDYPLVANIIAGQTKDSDSEGYVTQSYEMRSAEGSTTITPFTTLAALSDLSLQEIADQLGLDVEDISDDYIEKEDNSTHLLASVISDKLGDEFNGDSENYDISELMGITKKALEFIDNLELDNNSLKDLKITLNDDGELVVTTLENFLIDEDQTTPRYTASLNSGNLATEGVSAISYAQGNYLLTSENRGNYEGSYTITGINVTLLGDYSGTDSYIYIADQFALSTTDEDDLTVTAKVDIENTSEPFSDAELSGTTWYYLDNNLPLLATDIDGYQGEYTEDQLNRYLSYAQLTFDENEVTYSKTSYEDPLSSSEKIDYRITDQGYLNFADITLQKIAGNDDVILVQSKDDTEHFALLINSKTFAEKIYNNWLKGIGDLTSDDSEEEKSDDGTITGTPDSNLCDISVEPGKMVYVACYDDLAFSKITSIESATTIDGHLSYAYTKFNEPYDPYTTQQDILTLMSFTKNDDGDMEMWSGYTRKLTDEGWVGYIDFQQSDISAGNGLYNDADNSTIMSDFTGTQCVYQDGGILISQVENSLALQSGISFDYVSQTYTAAGCANYDNAVAITGIDYTKRWVYQQYMSAQ